MPDETRGTGNSRPNRLRAFWRRKIHPVWQVAEWPVVGAVWIVALVLGCLGFSRYAQAAGQAVSVLDIFYRALQLIVLQSGDVPAPIPWQLEVARLLMPAVAGYAAIQALLAIFREQLHLLGLHFTKNHVVICGLGERGLRLTQDFLEHGFRVVVVEKDEENPLIAPCREQGTVVLVGDAKTRSVLHRAGVQRAKYLVSVCADDGANAEIGLQARKLVCSRRGRPLTAFIHVDDLELCTSLREGDLGARDGGSFTQEFFNVPERGARLMLAEHPPFVREAREADRPPHMLIVGLGKMGRSLVMRAAEDWALKRTGSDQKLQISVIDKAGEAKKVRLCLQYPRLKEICDFHVWQLEKNDPEFDRGSFLRDSHGGSGVDAIYICFDDDVHALVNALTLHRKTAELGSRAPIVMRMSRDAGLATLLKEEGGRSDLGRIRVFGLLDRTCTLEALLRPDGNEKSLAGADPDLLG